MPTYDYICAGCGGFEAIRAIRSRDEPIDCPSCGVQAARVIAASQLAYLAQDVRHAHEVNERSAHAPRQSSATRHPSGCSCCSAARRRSTQVAPNGDKSFPGRRPWMISH